MCSAVLGLCAWLRDGKLRWCDPETGRELGDYDEVQAGREAAEEEIAKLRAQLRRLQGGPDT